jgi:predicted SAM-dependent methyltransferase
MNTPEGWINLDGSWNAWLGKHPYLKRIIKTSRIFPASRLDVPWNPDVVFHNARKPLPFPDDSMIAVYSSYLHEHLYLEEGNRLLRECYRILAPGGALRIIIPDFRSIMLEYAEGKPLSIASDEKKKMNPADRANARLYMHPPKRVSESMLDRVYDFIVDFRSHKYMYDAQSITHYFEQAKFINVQQMGHLESRIEGIEEIEKHVAVIEGASICIEGEKNKSDP